jgi:hypothetical protein
MARAAPGFARPHGALRRDRLVEGVPELEELAREQEGKKVAKNPTAHDRLGSRRHLVSVRGVILLAVVLTTANVHDAKVIEYLGDATGQIEGPDRRRPSKHPAKLHTAKGYDDFSVAARRSASAARRRASRELARILVRSSVGTGGGGAHAGAAGPLPHTFGTRGVPAFSVTRSTA